MYIVYRIVAVLALNNILQIIFQALFTGLSAPFYQHWARLMYVSCCPLVDFNTSLQPIFYFRLSFFFNLHLSFIVHRLQKNKIIQLLWRRKPWPGWPAATQHRSATKGLTREIIKIKSKARLERGIGRHICKVIPISSTTWGLKSASDLSWDFPKSVPASLKLIQWQGSELRVKIFWLGWS